MVVVDCLDDQDDTLKRKTLELLYKMTNPINVTFIVEKMVLLFSVFLFFYFL